MKHLLQRGTVVSLAPLLVALAALGVREATRTPFAVQTSDAHPTEFVPPALFLAMTRAPGVDQALRVDAERSTARATDEARDGAPTVQALRAQGSLRVLADETLSEFEVELAPQGGGRAGGWPADTVVHVRGASGRSRATAVPGVRACELQASLAVGGRSSDVRLDVTWIRLPGGALELHAVAPFDCAPFDLPGPWWGRMLPRPPRRTLGMDLVLHGGG